MTPKILTCHKLLTWQRFYLSCIVSMTRYTVASCFNRQFRENGLPSNLYRLHTKISFKPTNIPMWKILLSPRSLLKSKPNLIEHALDAIIASTDAKMFCQSDTVQLSSHLKISFSSFRRDYDNFLMAYFHHWNT